MERWSKQAGKHLAHKLSAIDNHDDLLLPAALRKFAVSEADAISHLLSLLPLPLLLLLPSAHLATSCTL